MVPIDEAAELLDIDLHKLIDILKENGYIDEEAKPLEMAISSGFMKPDGSIGRRGMTQLFSICSN